MMLQYLLLLLILICPSESFENVVRNPNSLPLSPLVTRPETSPTTTSIPRKASETASDFRDIMVSKVGSYRNRLSQDLREKLPMPTLVSSASAAIGDTLRKSWWMLPMFLAVVPLYCAFFKGTCAAMPDWWQVVNMENIRQSKDAALVIGSFLASNVAYFLSGAYLVHRFPFEKAGRRGLLMPTRFSMLGVWILASGLVSTVFHSVQALGSYAVAGALCYIDHGVAISSGCYYLETCGRPSKRVLGIGMISLVTLAATSPGYAWLHSTWHFLSAATATRWAVEGYARIMGDS